MPPEQQLPQTPATNQDPNYGFIFDDQKKSKKRFNLPGGNNTGKLALLVIGTGAILGVLIIVLSSVFGPKGIDKTQVVDIVARAEEISRVSAQITKSSTDVNTANLAATTSNTLTSDEAQLMAILSKNKIKIVSAELTIYKGKSTDSEMQTAIQNNRLSEYYYSYLKKNLTAYQAAMKATSESTSSTSLKNILNNSYTSTGIILSSQQLATAQ